MAEKGQNDYNPYEHREVKRPTNNFETGVHILKGAFGTGILALPQAFSHTGWLIGFIFTLLVSTCAIYSMNLLVKCIYALSKEQQVPNMTYTQCMEEGLHRGPNWMKPLARPSAYMVDIFIIAMQFGICAVYHVFIAENTKQIFDEYVINWDVRIWMLILFVPLLALAMIPDLKFLAPFSLVGNLLCFAGVCILLSYIVRDLPPIDDREMAVNVARYPLFLGIVLFSVAPVALVITVEQNMKNPQNFGGICGVLSFSLMILAILQSFFGFFGFWKYGEKCEGSVTLNVPQNEWLAHSSRIVYALAMFISHPLNAYVTVDIIWHQRFKSKVEEPNKQMCYEYIVRILNIVFTMILAIAVPHLGLFIALIGAFSLSALAFIFPAILDICVHWPDNLGPLKWVIIKDILLITFGLGGLISGTFVAVREIIAAS